MRKVKIICEGPTEESFVNKLLRPYFSALGIEVYPSNIGKSLHKKGGGDVSYNRIITDIRNWLKDSTIYCTTFVDYYGIDSDFPGKKESCKLRSSEDRQNKIHEKFFNSVQKDAARESSRFIPNIIMHEFEGLLFSSPSLFSMGIGSTALEKMMNEALKLKSPEDINDNINTAPSKRILKVKPDYSKTIDGINAALEIGLENIRKECPLFNKWINKIESLSNEK